MSGPGHAAACTAAQHEERAEVQASGNGHRHCQPAWYDFALHAQVDASASAWAGVVMAPVLSRSGWALAATDLYGAFPQEVAEKNHLEDSGERY